MEDKVYKVLEELGIKYEKVEHPALFTAEDDEKYGIKFDGVVCKNLFVRNEKKTKYYLIILPCEKRAKLKEIQQKLGETRFSFGSEDVLYEKLKIKSGSVSIFNIINVDKTDVKFIIDESLLKEKKVGFHPNVNTATVLFDPQYIEKILNKYKVEYEFIEI
jgi:Ala-tRNA(Pro) deacylase